MQTYNLKKSYIWFSLQVMIREISISLSKLEHAILSSMPNKVFMYLWILKLGICVHLNPKIPYWLCKSRRPPLHAFLKVRLHSRLCCISCQTHVLGQFCKGLLALCLDLKSSLNVLFVQNVLLSVDICFIGFLEYLGELAHSNNNRSFVSSLMDHIILIIDFFSLYFDEIMLYLFFFTILLHFLNQNLSTFYISLLIYLLLPLFIYKIHIYYYNEWPKYIHKIYQNKYCPSMHFKRFLKNCTLIISINYK